ncbi:unnamed protein product [Soboliphyme baturini]|uniref:Secreted protein n=1 Tax=Soboliphyme baturini TaxID=241478 RepID=A0A183IKI3_9BILA|nr:unnamed protein product [Soboliphyme baturini]
MVYRLAFHSMSFCCFSNPVVFTVVASILAAAKYPYSTCRGLAGKRAEKRKKLLANPRCGCTSLKKNRSLHVLNFTINVCKEEAFPVVIDEQLVANQERNWRPSSGISDITRKGRGGAASCGRDESQRFDQNGD